MAEVWQIVGIRIYLTGRVGMEANGQVVVNQTHIRGKQGRLAFAYLVHERTRTVPKEELATIIWPDEMSPAWEGALSAITSRIRTMVSIEPLKKEGVSFFRSSGQYQLDLPADVWIDLEAGFSAVDRAEAHLRNGSPEQVLGPAGAAACIARRPFLPGIEGFWADSLRGKLHCQLLRALDCLSESQRLVGEPMVAVETGTEAVKLDNLRERGYQLLMQAYSAAGNRAEALNVYHQCREILAAELGAEPSQETQDIYLSLLE